MCDIEALDDISAVLRGRRRRGVRRGRRAGQRAGAQADVDYGGAVKLIEAAKANGIDRYVMVSAISADRPDEWSEQMRPYYEAKAGGRRARCSRAASTTRSCAPAGSPTTRAPGS